MADVERKSVIKYSKPIYQKKTTRVEGVKKFAK